MKKILILIALLVLVVPCLAVNNPSLREAGGKPALRRYLKKTLDNLDQDITEAGQQLGTGDIWYVDSGSGLSASGAGTSWEGALLTLDEAFALCTANNGDIVYIAQNHAESWDAGDDADHDKDGVTVIGLGVGTDRPTFTYTGTGGEYVLDSANGVMRNLVFQPGIADVTHAIEVTADADGAIIENCEFLTGSVEAYEFVDAIQPAAAADDLIIRYNKATEGPTAGAVSWLDISAGVVENLSVYGNNIYGDYSTGIVDGTGRIHLLAYFGYNTITNLSSDDYAFYFNAAVTGVLEHNTIYTNAEATAIDPGSLSCFENYVATTQDVSGMITPVYDNGTTQLNATTCSAVATAVNALAGYAMLATCETNVAGAAEVKCAALDGYGDDYFNTGWSLVCIHDHDAPGTAQEGEIRDIENYVSTAGVFTVDPDFSAAVTADDDILVVRTNHLNPHMPAAAGSTGNIWYCDDGGSGGDGKTWTTAKTTLETAEALMSAGDILYVGANHNEPLGTTANLAVVGITVIGMGEGDARPLFDYDTTDVELTLNAANITLKNLRFRPGVTLTVAAIVLSSNGIGCTIENCDFEDGEGANEEFIDCIVADPCSAGLTVKNCTYFNVNETAGDPDAFINLDAGTIADVSIIGCNAFGQFDEACIWSDAVNTNLLIKDNVLSNNRTGQLAIEFQDAATGMCVDNKLSGDTYGSILDPGSMKCHGNTQTVGIDSAAIDIPLVAGKTYALTKADGTAHSDDLFSVTGGPILITSFTGYCVTAIGGTVTTTIILDHASLADREFTSSVDINTLDEGGLLIFTEANPAVVTIVNLGANTGASQLMDPWYCPVGMIENVNDDPTQTGVISWSMTFIPLTDGVAVIPQG